MIRATSTWGLTLALGAALMTTGCDDADPPTTAPGNIVSVAVADGRFGTLASLLVEEELDATLSGAGPFTVFAPTDDAFQALPAGTLEAIRADGDLAQVLKFHVVSGRLSAADVAAKTSLTTLAGVELPVDASGAIVKVGGVNITQADVAADNGVIHVLGGVLVPPKDTPQKVDIVATATAAGGFTTLLTAVEAAGLTATLKGTGPFTVFAPTDAAFDALPAGTVDAVLADIPTLTNILTYHVYSGSLDAAGVTAETSLTMLNGDSAAIVVADGVVTIAGVTISMTDIETSNGIIHVLDAVMIPPAAPSLDIIETATDNGSFGTLLAAVDAAGLTDTLKGDGPFTVFAPTDAAFDALPAGTVAALLADIPTLTNILTYHVYSGSLDAAGVTAETSLTMLNGDSAAIVVDAGVVTIAGVTISMTDVKTSNGIIHVLDAVMTPPAAPGLDIIETATDNGSFGTLLAAVDAAGLTDTLKGDGPFTVFAPTDAAFDALPDGTVAALLADIPTLTDILTYHVYSGSLDAAGVTAETSLTMLNGDSAAIVVDGGVVTIAGVVISMTDVQTSNGIIHVLDAVMSPPLDIIETAADAGSFGTLLTAVEAAGLTDTLKGDGPFTVFAPTDAAFEALPAGTVDALLADIPALTDILTYHVYSGSLDAAGVTAETTLTMLNGVKAQVIVENGVVTIGGAEISVTDIQTANGIIHVLDAVMLPPKDIVATAMEAGSFTTLLAAVDAADLTTTLQGDGPFTVFAPTDAAFAALPAGTVDALLADIPTLTNILTYHVFGDYLLAADVLAATELSMLNGDAAPIAIVGGEATIGGATIVTTDILCRNGVIHVIDAVIMPPMNP